jgi:hypothetical protein
MGFWQIWISRHVQPGRSAFNPAQHQMLHSIKANGTAFKGALYSGLHVRDPECLQQPQHLNEPAFPLFAHPGLHETAQDKKGFGQLSISQRGSLIKRIGLLFDQRQIMKRIIDVILLLPRPDMAGDDFSAAGNYHLMHISERKIERAAPSQSFIQSFLF